MARLLPDWLDAYLEYVDNSEPPELFKVWSGVSTIAAALQRKCWLEWDTAIYPNLFVVLVGPSGVRKGSAMAPAIRLLTKLGIAMCPQSLTREALIGRMAASTASFIGPHGLPVQHSSLTIFSTELVVFVNKDAAQMIRDLPNLYDSEDVWKYETKSRGVETVEGVCLNLLGATTPDLIKTSLPQESIGGGLTSRIIFVYAGKKSKLVPYPVRTEREMALENMLYQDLGEINIATGQFAATEAFIDTYTAWYSESESKTPFDLPQLAPYLERRSTHLRKLCMTMNASRADGKMILTPKDFERALALLERTEDKMPNVFMGYGKSVHSEMYPRIIRFIIKRGGRVTERELLQTFYSDITKEELFAILTTLAGAGYVKLERTKERELVVYYTDKKGDHQ